MRMFAATLLVSVGLCGLSAGAIADDESAIKYRKSIMAAVAGHAGALGLIGKGQVPHESHAQAHAHALKALSMQVLDAFKEETVGESRAKENVWSDAAGFQAAAKEFQTAAADLAAASDGQGDMGAAMKALFGSCKGCHKDYRAKKK